MFAMSSGRNMRNAIGLIVAFAVVMIAGAPAQAIEIQICRCAYYTIVKGEEVCGKWIAEVAGIKVQCPPKGESKSKASYQEGPPVAGSRITPIKKRAGQVGSAKQVKLCPPNMVGEPPDCRCRPNFTGPNCLTPVLNR
jgi:hypothetical protein